MWRLIILINYEYHYIFDHSSKDFTNDPSFKSHTDWAEKLRREMQNEERDRQYDKDSARSRNIIILSYILGTYLGVTSFAILNFQVRDECSESLPKQLFRHFTGDPALSWKSLIKKKQVKERLEEYRLDNSTTGGLVTAGYKVSSDMS